MNNIGKPERATQNRVIQLFRNELNYDYLGDWYERENNCNIEETLLSDYLTRSGYNAAQISGAIKKLKDAANQHSQNLYNKNKAVYSLLRYGAAIMSTTVQI
jgi:type I restriction enzyme R subunit